MNRHEMLGALARNELLIHYQPQWSTTNSQIAGIEALIRWRAGSALLLPDQFLDNFAAAGLNPELGRYTMDRVCMDIRQLVRQNIPVDHVGVNFSCGQLASDNFQADMVGIMNSRDVDPSIVMIEITESDDFSDLDKLRDTIETLAALGVQFALDDFCTGYSTLDHICSLPIDAMKIDKTFVSKITEYKTKIVIEYLIEIAHRMGVVPIAEGVESYQQVKLLDRMGCDLFQGYYYARPMELCQLLDYCSANRIGKPRLRLVV